MTVHGDTNDGTLIGIFETPEFARKFIVKRELGRGANSVVYLAEDLLLQRDVALKVMKFQADEIARERFLREGRVCTSLKHPNIVQVFSFGADSNEAYLAMELLHGVTLERILQDSKTLLKERFQEIFLPILDALETLHGLELLHRDIKPANIMIMDDAEKTQVKLLDFGLSKGLLEGSALSKTLTVADTGVGTPAYMSPEQCRGSKCDYRSDIYSLSCVMYESLVGKPPFIGNTAVETMYMQMNQKAILPAELDTGVKVPMKLIKVVLRGLEKDPAERPGSAVEFKALLLEALKSEGYLSRKSTNRRAPYLVLGGIACCLGIYFIFSGSLPKKPAVNELLNIKTDTEYISPSKVVRRALNARLAGDYKSSISILENADSRFEKRNDKPGRAACLRELVEVRLQYAESLKDPKMIKALAAEALSDIDTVLKVQFNAFTDTNLPMQMARAYKIFGMPKEGQQRLERMAADLEKEGIEHDVKFARILTACEIACYSNEDYLAAQSYGSRALEGFEQGPFARTDPTGTLAALTYVETLKKLKRPLEAKAELDKTKGELINRTCKHDGIIESFSTMVKYLTEHGAKKDTDIFHKLAAKQQERLKESIAESDNLKRTFIPLK